MIRIHGPKPHAWNIIFEDVVRIIKFIMNKIKSSNFKISELIRSRDDLKKVRENIISIDSEELKSLVINEPKF